MDSARRARPRSSSTLCPDRRIPATAPSGLHALPDDVAAARHLIAAGCAADAVRLLATHLAGCDFSWLPADPLLIDACVLYATHATGRDQLAAARYAQRASRHLHEQPTHPRRLDAARAYGTALHAHGRYADAIGVYRRLLGAYRTLGRPLDLLATTISLAASLHAAGHCAEALRVIGYTWHLWQHAGPAATHVTETIAVTHVAMLRACRRDDDLRALLHHHRHTDAATILAMVAADTGPDDDRHLTVCSHPPHALQAPPAGMPRHSEHRNLGGGPPSPSAPALLPDDASRHPSAGGHDAGRGHPLAGYPTRDVAKAISHALCTPQAQTVLCQEPGSTLAGQELVATIAGYLAHRRGLRAALYTAAVLTAAAFAVSLALLLPT